MMDIQQVIFFLPMTILAIVACLFLMLWHLGLSSSWQWSSGFALSAAGFSLSAFPIEPVFDEFVSGIFYIVAAYFYGTAILVHFDRPLRLTMRRALVAVFMVPHIYFVLVAPDLRWDLFLIDGMFAVLFGYALRLAMPAVRTIPDVALVFATALVAADCVARAVVFTFLVPVSADLADFVASGYNLWVHVSTITVCLLFPLAAILAMAASTVSRYRGAAERDPLTGLLNRRGFDHLVEGSTAFLRRQGAVIVCDIDYFKLINDTYGHAVGDRVITSIAAELASSGKGEVHVSRFGGEEFTLYLTDASEAEATDIAGSLQRRIARRTWEDAGVTGPITASFGVAAVSAQDSSIHAAIQRADKALYIAKISGRNRVVAASSPLPQPHEPALRPAMS